MIAPFSKVIIMPENLTLEQRHRCMASIGSKNTHPEIVVRKWLFRNGYRYRLHETKLPGKPDIVMPRYRTAIFINGCFWHRHAECKRASMPINNQDYWRTKFDRNIQRDLQNVTKLEESGWQVIVIWECEIRTKRFIEILEMALT